MIHFMFIETFELLLSINTCHLLCEAQRIFFINDKPSWIYPVKNNVTDVTRYAGQGFLSFVWNKSHEIVFLLRL